MASKGSTTIFSLKFEDNDDNIEIVPETMSESGYQNEFYNSIVDNLPKVVEVSSIANPADSVCSKCGKTYKYLALFQKHTKICEGGSISPRETLHACSQCQKVYKNRMSYEKHVLFCTDSTSTPCLLDRSRCFCCAEANAHVGNIQCVKCPKMFHTQQGYSRHLLLLHAETTKYKCELCTVQCSNNYILKLHRESHKEEIERLDRNCPEYKCNVCGKCFLDKTALDIHINNHKRNDIQPTISYNCKICNLELPSLEKFYGHLCENNKMKFKCEFCGRFLSSVGFYRRHINTHKKYNALTTSAFSEQCVSIPEPTNKDNEKCEMIEIDSSMTIVADDESNEASDTRMDIQKKVMSIFDLTPPSAAEPPQKVRILNGRTVVEQKPRILNLNAPTSSITAQPMRILNGTKLTNNNNTKAIENTDNGKTNAPAPLKEKDFEAILKSLRTENIMNENFFPMDDNTLRDSVISLLKVMLDIELLEEFGFYTVPVEQVLTSVLKQLEFEPFADSDDIGMQLRENVKLLLKSMCDDKSAIENIDNIYKVDIVLRELISCV